MTEQQVYTTAIIAAVPTQDDPIHQVVAEDAHVTLQFLGEAADLTDDQIAEIKQSLEMLAAVVYPFEADISGTAELGPNKAQVLIVQNALLSQIREMLGTTSAVSTAVANSEQFPNWIPHLTLAYEGEMPDVSQFSTVTIGSIELWLGSEAKHVYELSQPKTLAAAGIHEFEEGLHPRGADGRFIEKFGVIKYLTGQGWQYGKVEGIYHDKASGAVKLTVTPSDLSGKTHGSSVTLSPKQVYRAPTSKAHLPTSAVGVKKVGGQAGSNQGGLYEIPVQKNLGTTTGFPVFEGTETYYVKKPKTKSHGNNEALANALYEEAGVPVPEVDLHDDGQLYSKIVKGQQDMQSQLNNPEWTDQVRRNFAVDAWLGNRDVFGMTYDNILTDEHGVPWRIDNGGALLYRAMGEKKTDFGGKVTELDAFRTGKKAKIFGPGMTKAQELDGAERVLAISPGQIDDMVKDHGMPQSLADTLKARRAYIADYYGLALPESKTPAEAEGPTSAPLLDPPDIAENNGKTRNWFKTTLSKLAFFGQGGDNVELPDGTRVIVGKDDEGQPLSIVGMQAQVLGWTTQYQPDAEIFLRKFTSVGKPRPEHGSKLLGSDLTDQQWKRGDKLVNPDGKAFKVQSWNSGTGAMLIQHGSDPELMLDTKGKDATGVWTVERWDPPAVDTTPIQTEDQASNALADVLAKAEASGPAKIEVLHEPSTDDLASYTLNPQTGKYDAVQTPSEPQVTAPQPGKTGQAAEAEAKIKADLDQPLPSGNGQPAPPKTSAPGGAKTMVIGDGTEASTGDAVTSKKDGKTYKFVKPKGQYAVVTDPNGEDPEKQLLKLASTMFQPGKQPAADVEVEAPKTATGEVPALGMMAVAKDGWAGEITLISPDGKFVFITDANGKRKRKSTGTVSVTSAPAPIGGGDKPTGDPAKNTPAPDVPKASTIPGPLKPYGEAPDYQTAKAQLDFLDMDDPANLDAADMVAVGYADGSIGLEPYSGQPIESLVTNTQGQVGTHNSIVTFKGTVESSQLVKAATAKNNDFNWSVVWNGHVMVTNGQAGPSGGLMLWDYETPNDYALEIPSGQNVTLLSANTAEESISGILPDPAGIPSAQFLTPDTGFFAPVAPLYGDEAKTLADWKSQGLLAVGTEISLDGKNWLEVQHVFSSGGLYAKDDNGVVAQIPSGSQATWVLKAPELADGDQPSPAWNGISSTSNLDLDLGDLPVSTNKKKIGDLVQGDVVTDGNGDTTIIDSVSAYDPSTQQVHVKAYGEDWGSPADPNFEFEHHGNLKEGPVSVPSGLVAPHLFPGAKVELGPDWKVQVVSYPQQKANGNYWFVGMKDGDPAALYGVEIGDAHSADISGSVPVPVDFSGGFQSWQDAGVDGSQIDAMFAAASTEPVAATDHHSQMTDQGIPFGTAAYPIYYGEQSETYFRQGPTSFQEWDAESGTWNNVFGSPEGKTKVWDGVPFEGELKLPEGYPSKIMADSNGTLLTDYKPQPGEVIQVGKVQNEQTILIAYPNGLDGPAHMLVGADNLTPAHLSSSPFQNGWKESGAFTDLVTIHDPFTDEVSVDTVPHQEGPQPPAAVGAKLQAYGYTPKPGESFWVSVLGDTGTVSILSKQEDGTYKRINSNGELAPKAWTPEMLKDFDVPGETISHYTWTYMPEGAEAPAAVQGLPAGFQTYIPGDGQSVLKVTLPNGKQNVYVQKQPGAGWYEMGSDGVVLENSDAVKSNFAVQQKLAGKGSQAAKYELLWPNAEGSKPEGVKVPPTFTNDSGTWTPEPHQSVVSLTSSTGDTDPWFFVQDEPGGPWTQAPNTNAGIGQVDDSEMNVKLSAYDDGSGYGWQKVYDGQNQQAALDAPGAKLPPAFDGYTPAEGEKVLGYVTPTVTYYYLQKPGEKNWHSISGGEVSDHWAVYASDVPENLGPEFGNDYQLLWPPQEGASAPETAAQTFNGYTPVEGDTVIKWTPPSGNEIYLVKKADDSTETYKPIKTDGTINPSGGIAQYQMDQLQGTGDKIDQVWPAPGGAGAVPQAGVFGGYQTAPGDSVVQVSSNTGDKIYVKKADSADWYQVKPDGTLDDGEGQEYSQSTMEWVAGNYSLTELQGTLKPGAPVTPEPLITSVDAYAGVADYTDLDATHFDFPGYAPSQEQWKKVYNLKTLSKGQSLYVLENAVAGDFQSTAVLIRNSDGSWKVVMQDGTPHTFMASDEDTEHWVSANNYVLHKAQFGAPKAAPAPVSTGPKAQLSGWADKGVPAPASFNYVSDITQAANAKAGDFVFVHNATGQGGGLVVQLSHDVDPGSGSFKASQILAVDAGGVISSQNNWIPAKSGEDPFVLNWGDANNYYVSAGLAPSTAPVAAPAASSAPSAPAAPVSTYPGQHKPSQEDINAWGGDLTKDGHIPTPGMFVTGKGPMSGKIVGVSKDKSKATVLKADGTKTTRLISALKTDAATNYQTYAMPASSKVPVPSGMALAVDTPDEAMAKTLADGKFRAIVSDHAGVLNGEMTVTAATAPSGKKFNRVHLTLTDAQREQLVSMLSGTGEKGDWVPSSKQSDAVAIGDKIPMRQSSTNNPDGTPRWKVDSSIVPPTHEVTGVQEEAGTGVRIVTLKNLTTGEEITSRFHPGKSLATYTWDPNKPKKVSAGAFALGAAAKAQGWSFQNDGVISAVHQDGKLDVEPGKSVPGSSSMWAGGAGMNSTWSGLRNVTSDGVVVEITDPKGPNGNSNSGFTTISVPEGMGAEALNGALAKLGIDYSPMTQDGAKKHVRGLLRNLMDFDSQDVESAKHYTDEALFTKAGQAIGLSDLGWQDVLVGVDESTGKVSYFWSTRVQTALANKAKHNLIYRAAATGDANAIVSTVKYGTANAILKRATGMIYAPSGKGVGASPGSDNSHHAGHGGFASATNANKLPTSNSQAHYKSSGMMVYMRPEAVLGRIMDYRVSKSDAFGGGEGKGSNSLANASSWTGVKDYFLGGGLPSEAISFIAVSSASERSKAITQLHAEGITQINGRAIEEIVILQSEAGKYGPKDLPVVVPPANARPVLDLPNSYDAPAPAGGAVTADASEAAA